MMTEQELEDVRGSFYRLTSGHLMAKLDTDKENICVYHNGRFFEKFPVDTEISEIARVWDYYRRAYMDGVADERKRMQQAFASLMNLQLNETDDGK